MADINFSELEILVQSFLIGTSTGIILGFSMWVLHMIVNVFKKFF